MWNNRWLNHLLIRSCVEKEASPPPPPPPPPSPAVFNSIDPRSEAIRPSDAAEVAGLAQNLLQRIVGEMEAQK